MIEPLPTLPRPLLRPLLPLLLPLSPRRLPSRLPSPLLRLLAWCLLAIVASTANAATPVLREGLPDEVLRALRSAEIAPEHMVALVQPVQGGMSARLAWQVRKPVNPASLMKLWTTAAALEMLGPDWRWKTPVWLTAPLPAPGSSGAYNGDIVIRGSGDPTLVIERLWLLVQRLRQLGIQDIRGDIVLDRSAFRLEPVDPGAFDAEPLRPYNVQPDALLLNHKAFQLGFVPDRAAGIARLTIVPTLNSMRLPAAVPLSDGPCNDWRAGLRADFVRAGAIEFAGSYPWTCGERRWPVADPDPASFNARVLTALWREVGGSLQGRVRDGLAPPGSPSFELESPPLSDVVRDINKFSNNVMAQQLFLTLPLAAHGDASFNTARALLRDWARGWLGEDASAMVVDNGSGLSRDNRTSAAALGQLLQRVWNGPQLGELLASLPVSGIDGTLRRSRLTPGRAHLKTGSLRDVVGIAGYVLADDGRRHVVVAVINHPHADTGRPALEALAAWAMRSVPR